MLHVLHWDGFVHIHTYIHLIVLVVSFFFTYFVFVDFFSSFFIALNLV